MPYPFIFIAQLSAHNVMVKMHCEERKWYKTHVFTEEWDYGSFKKKIDYHSYVMLMDQMYWIKGHMLHQYNFYVDLGGLGM